jgi:CHAT domain-containing protein
VVRGEEANKLPPLPGTRTEVQTISQMFRDSDRNADVYLGWQAATATLAELQQADKLRDYQYVHLAAHGKADAGGAQIILSLGDGIGELRADEVLMNWDLNAEQVVLSACQSGRGKRVGGEGFLGFAQSLLIAGAHSVVLSLWKVDDQATTLLMQRYYQNLLGARPDLTAPMPKAEALREAKQWLRSLPPQEAMTQLAVPALGHKAGPEERPFDHPSYWSAFILIGDPQ